MTRNNIFERNCSGITEKLQQKTVAIAGLGGLGSNAAIALVRAGIGKLIIVDFDKVELSNLNRQHYFQSDLGRLKSEALRDHLININPDIKLEVHNKKLKLDYQVFRFQSQYFSYASLMILIGIFHLFCC